MGVELRRLPWPKVVRTTQRRPLTTPSICVRVQANPEIARRLLAKARNDKLKTSNTKRKPAGMSS